MNLFISKDDIIKQLVKQLDSLFLINAKELELLTKNIDQVLERCEYNFSRNSNKYYHCEGITIFNPYISTQYLIFLYYFANTIYKKHGTVYQSLCDKIYLLNKTLNACDIYYQIELPDFFMVEHPVGSVMGRAKYGEGFLFYQGTTVGANKNIYPQLGKNVRMYANSSIIGNCCIGDNVILGAGALIKDCDIPSDSMVFGVSPNLIIKSTKI